MFTAVLSKNAQAALALLGKSGLVADAYLAGGSALSLRCGHRYSIDFDFFSPKRFDPKKLIVSLKNIANFTADFAKGQSLLGEFNQVKFSYFFYDYPLIAKTTKFLGVNLAHPHDIAAMKLAAISDRGAKKDYVDLFEIIHQGISFENMFKFYDRKYHLLSSNLFTLIKAIGYFDETETSQMPQMIKPVSWEQVKNFLASESLRLARKHLA